jgi:hypothetical protein
MRRVGGAVIAALVVIGGLAIPEAGAATVRFQPAPVAGWSTNGIVKAVLVAGDTVYVGGQFTQVRGPGGSPTAARTNLAAFDRTTGALRTGFLSNTNGYVRQLATDGTKLFVGGSFTSIGNVNRSRLAALDLNTGAVDTVWAAGANSNVYALEVRGTRLYVGGSFSTLGSVTRNRVGVVSTATGTLDTAFNPNANGTVLAIAASPDGNRVYLGGEFSTIGSASRRYAATVSATSGAIQPLVFQYSTYAEVIDIDVSTDGSQVFAALGGLENSAIAWNTTNGNRQWYYQVDGDTQAIRYYDGNVYFGFHEGALDDHSVRMLVADAASGAIVQSFRPTVNSFYGVWDIDVNADALVIGGEFTNVAGVNVQGVGIFQGTGGTPTSTSSTSSTSSTTTTTTTTTPGNPTGGTLVAQGATWRYLDNGSNPGTAWRATSFNDGSWKQGPAQLGYGDGDEQTVVSYGPNAGQKYLTSYYRRQFLADPASFGSTLTLNLLRDDGAVVYLNGTEVVRTNIPAGTVTSTTYSVTNVSGNAEQAFLTFSIPANLLVSGTNTIAVEIHQDYRGDPDSSFDLSLAG